MFKRTFIAALILISNVSLSYASEPYLLLNKQIKKTNISDSYLRKIFLGRQKLSENGIIISPCYLADDEIKKVLYKITDKTHSSFRRYWNMRLFSGQGRRVKEIKNKRRLYQYMSDKAGAICLSYYDEDLPSNIVAIPLKQPPMDKDG